MYRDSRSAGDLSNDGRGPALRGRRLECHALERLLENVRGGASCVLALRGALGVGKSALLDHLVVRADEIRVLRAAGVESEMALPYSGLHQLCAPVLELRDGLPVPQRDALEAAFGLSAKPVPSDLVVGLAVLGLLCEVAAAGPLLCVVDDAQWLDSASALTLAFVARRLPAESIGFVLAVNEPCEMNEFSGLPALVVGGLSEPDARALLESALPGRVDEIVRDRIASESRGNPLTLHQLARGAGPGKLAGGFAVPEDLTSVNRPEWNLVQRLESLALETQRLLLVAAAEPLGDVALLWHAAERLGLTPDAAVPAQAAGLIDLGAVVRFSHPMLRSAVYHRASLPARREAHRALAEATDPDVDPDRRAWHLAHATDTPDEDVAAELELSASRAAARGGAAAAAAFLGLATNLTPDPYRRGQRALEAAERKLEAGEFENATSLLATARVRPLGEAQRARLDLTRGRIALATGRVGEASRMLVATARTLESLDIEHAREAYLEALSAAMLGGHLASGSDPFEVAQAARAVTSAPGPHNGDVLLDALVVRVTGGYAAAVPLAAEAVETACGDHGSAEGGPRRLWLRSATAADLFDDERWDILSACHVKKAREAGLLSELPLALDSRVFLHLFAGELAAAAALVEEAQMVSEVTGGNLARYGALGLAAWRGREGEARTLIEATYSEFAAGGEGIGWTFAHWASALLSNGLCRYEEAVAAATEAARSQGELRTPNWGLIELIEAAARCGRTELASESLHRLSEMTCASGTDWALGARARSRALLSAGDRADRLYREAIERLRRTRMRSELARARLLYGEWLRREGRRTEARAQLRAAHDLFVTIGMEAFAVRARRELLATGEKARKRSVETRDELTPQERQIAELARDGLSNTAIGGRLFLSPRTVEWHLRKVFTKLGIRSRHELANAMPSSEPEPVPA